MKRALSFWFPARSIALSIIGLVVLAFAGLFVAGCTPGQKVAGRTAVSVASDGCVVVPLFLDSDTAAGAAAKTVCAAVKDLAPLVEEFLRAKRLGAGAAPKLPDIPDDAFPEMK